MHQGENSSQTWPNLLPLYLHVMSQGELTEAASITISMAGGFANEATVKRFSKLKWLILILYTSLIHHSFELIATSERIQLLHVELY